MGHDDVVCDCQRVTRRRIEAAIESGARSVDDVARTTAAGTGCGQCRREVRRMLRARWWRRLLPWRA